eukprot:SM000003S11115  [mRNA]  locus=s3:1031108:1033925:+ [translate_table: standard]
MEYRVARLTTLAGVSERVARLAISGDRPAITGGRTATTPASPKPASKAAGQFGGTQDKCLVCSKTVYPIEKLHNAAQALTTMLLNIGCIVNSAGSAWPSLRELRHGGPAGLAELPGGGALVPGPRRGMDVCNNCRRPGHYARECPNAAVCNKCQKAGHLAASCPNEVLCRNCKQPGHVAADCANEAVCNLCGTLGHLARACPAATGGGGGSGIAAGAPCSQASPADTPWTSPPLAASSDSPGHIAAECTNEQACNNCRQPGHLARDCMNLPVCNTCGQEGHIAFDCSSGGGALGAGTTYGGAGAYRGVACHSCGQVGHIARNCPLSFGGAPPLQYMAVRGAAAAAVMGMGMGMGMGAGMGLGRGSNDGLCRNCKQPGHVARDCSRPTVCNNCGGIGHLAAQCPSEDMRGR